mmetsp:Transcript_5076/g.7679  ORF Transcript_5076/g.7679 Transcript_5076/m.7679 type:complete len:119 (+) Transcript_5076:294-650(+)
MVLSKRVELKQPTFRSLNQSVDFANQASYIRNKIKLNDELRKTQHAHKFKKLLPPDTISDRNTIPATIQTAESVRKSSHLVRSPILTPQDHKSYDKAKKVQTAAHGTLIHSRKLSAYH